MITITTCPFCGKETAITFLSEDYTAWQNGELAQNAFPYLSAEEREMLISGICPTCWEKTFGVDEAEEEIDEDYCPNDWHDLDMGFDPYEGAYTFDC